ncbi:Heparanase [Folsomia candida]|uniref:Heparanase n=1 Tax=Folsomia candida TaxID=158441 RepID=A0A226DKS9_FOLCA|nr:Heparanase [Folsomia candida]
MHLFQLFCIFVSIRHIRSEHCPNDDLELELDLDQLRIAAQVDKRFLSFALDSFLLGDHWRRTNLRDPKLISLTKQLTPAYLRVGGTDQDNLIFCPGAKFGNVHDNTIDALPCSTTRESKNSTIPITESDIKELGQFVKVTGVDLVYGLNVLERHGGQWNPANSVRLMNYMDALEIPVAGWELGNEPLRFPKVFNKSVRAGSLGRDFNLLKSLLSQISRYSNSAIFGPDVTSIRKAGSPALHFLAEFLQECDNSTLSGGVTFHDYYFSGSTATILDFLDVRIMDKLTTRIQLVKRIVRTRFQQPDIPPLWLGETSTAFGGGSTNISDRFVACFTWVSK